MKRTYQPNKSKQKKKHGFLIRMSKVGGRRVIQQRRRKKRIKLSH